MKKYLISVLLFSVVTSVSLASAQAASSFIPPEGNILLFIGQDQSSIESYIKEIGVTPAGFMVYTSLQKADGLLAPVDYGAGSQFGQYFADTYSDTVIQLGLYMVDALDGALRGEYDQNIKKLAAWIKSVKRPVYVRIGYEFDGAHNHYDSEKYVKVYKRIVDMLRQGQVNNAAFVWHSSGQRLIKPLSEWYPGDEYVDWCAISYFFSQTDAMQELLRFAQEHHKPVMIAEATPCGIGIHFPGYALERWFEPFFKFIEDHNIKAVSYINCDWDSYPMWKGQGWKDSRVQVKPKIKERWIEEISKPKYLNQREQLYDLLGYNLGKRD